MPRVIRAIEIYETLHESKSDVISRLGELRPRDPALSSSKGEQKKCSYDLLIFGVEQSTDALKKRINERTDAMIEAGWIEEVQELLRRGYTEADPGMKSHGYRQIMQYLSELEAGDVDPDAMKKALKENIAAKTRQYAKRQMTWWRGDNRIRWIRS